MEKQFVPYKQSSELKELGFNEKCISYYHCTQGYTPYVHHHYNDKGYKKEDLRSNESTKTILAPLWQQAFDWFREKYDLLSYIDHYPREEELERSFYVIRGELVRTESEGSMIMSGWFSSYEEAREACLDKLIEIVKNKEAL